jgi:hypothetical protein
VIHVDEPQAHGLFESARSKGFHSFA